MRTVVIVGAGFSGAVAAVQLMRLARGGALHIILINRSGPMGRGLAYGTASPDHVLNVPAGNMSALADVPDHFLDWCRHADPGVTAASFVPRQRYGDYLTWLLEESERAAAPSVRLSRVAEQVESVTPLPRGARLRVRCTDGVCYLADRVLLALGHAPPRNPPVADTAFFTHAQYFRDPWRTGALDGDGPVLLLGTGLTMVDVANKLLGDCPTRIVYALSRRGLLPQPHRVARSPVEAAPDLANILTVSGSVRTVMRALRGQISAAQADGGDWRTVIAALRPWMAPWWQALPDTERRRFLRHVQPYWDCHRHRVSPEQHQQFLQACDQGRLRVMAGRILAFAQRDGDVTVSYRPRAGAVVRNLTVSRVINCTGPESDPRRMDDPLLRQLLSAGLMQADALGQGLSLSADGALIDAAGACVNGIYYLGPLLKARDWEATAVPELRQFARRFAVQTLRDWRLDGDQAAAL